MSAEAGTAPPRGESERADIDPGADDEAPPGQGIDGVSIDRKATPASLRTIAMPADTNPNGDIFGGWILSQMDLAGGTFARYVARGRVATVALTGMKFHKPVSVGDEISCYCRTERIGTTSVTVLVEAWVRRTVSGTGGAAPDGSTGADAPEPVAMV